MVSVDLASAAAGAALAVAIMSASLMGSNREAQCSGARQLHFPSLARPASRSRQRESKQGDAYSLEFLDDRGHFGSLGNKLQPWSSGVPQGVSPLTSPYHNRHHRRRRMGIAMANANLQGQHRPRLPRS